MTPSKSQERTTPARAASANGNASHDAKGAKKTAKASATPKAAVATDKTDKTDKAAKAVKATKKAATASPQPAKATAKAAARSRTAAAPATPAKAKRPATPAKAAPPEKAEKAEKAQPAEKPARAARAAPAPAAGRAASVDGAAAPLTRGPYAEDTRFLDEQRELLVAERSVYQGQAADLKAEADSLAEDREPGDVQFDEESGEGGTVTVDRERDLALSAQAMAAVAEINEALERIEAGTYGACERCHQAIPKTRLRALPFARLCVACKSGGLSRR